MEDSQDETAPLPLFSIMSQRPSGTKAGPRKSKQYLCRVVGTYWSVDEGGGVERWLCGVRGAFR